MLFSVKMRAALSAVTIAVISSGCASEQFLSLGQRLDAPDPINIINYSEEFSRLSGAKIQTVGDYVLSGYAYVDHHCQRFFTELELSAMHGNFAKDAVTLTATAATQIVSATTGVKDLQRAVSILAALSGLGSSLIDKYNNIYHFAPYSGLLWNQVRVASDTYKTRVHTDTLNATVMNRLIRGSVSDHALAHQAVQGYARICTIPQMQVFVHTSLVNTKVTPADQAQKPKAEASAEKPSQPTSGNKSGGNKESAGGTRGVARSRPMTFPTFVAQ